MDVSPCDVTTAAVERLLGELERPVPLDAFERWAGAAPTTEQLAAAGWVQRRLIARVNHDGCAADTGYVIESQRDWLFPPGSAPWKALLFTGTEEIINWRTLETKAGRRFVDGVGIEEWHSPESIRDAARHCHEMNRTWCALRGDTSQVGWDDAPEWQRESAIEGVKFHLANPHAGPSGSHENWMRHKLADGWVYGPQKDPEKKTHPCLVPYAELSADQRAKDAFFVATLHALFPEVFEPPQLTWTE